jgi:hypothetical protein
MPPLNLSLLSFMITLVRPGTGLRMEFVAL